MSAILLAHSYFLRLDPKQWEKMRPYPPLGTLYAAEVLRNVGHDVAVFDAMLAEGEYEFADALSRHQPRHVVLFEDNFNFLSKMCLARMREAALAMVTMAKDAGCRVALPAPTSPTTLMCIWLVAPMSASSVRGITR